MKKNALFILLSINSISLQASQPQSWWSKNVGIAVGVSAAVSGAVTGLALWQWKKSVATQEEQDRQRDKVNQITQDIATQTLESEKVSEALKLNTELYELHMNKEDYQIVDKLKSIESLFPQNSNVSGLGLRTYSEFLAHQRCNFPYPNNCTACKEHCAVTADNSAQYYKSRRSAPCFLIDSAYKGVKASLERAKTSVDDKLKVSTEAHAQATRQAINHRKTNHSLARFQWKVLGCTSAAVSAASLAYLGLRAQK